MALIEKEPRYGFEIVNLLSGYEGLVISEGTIYPLLSRLNREKLVETEWRESESGPPRKYYDLTAAGRVRLFSFRDEWLTFRAAVDSVIGGEIGREA